MPLRILSRGEDSERQQRHADRRLRRHGVVLEPADRRDLERAGWRTTLEYRENHVRARNGTLLEVRPAWYAEAERDPARRSSTPDDRGVDVISAIAETADGAWSALRIQAEIADVRRRDAGSQRAS